MFSNFRQVFGSVRDGSSNSTTGFQCAEVRNTSNRLWVRMVDEDMTCSFGAAS